MWMGSCSLPISNIMNAAEIIGWDLLDALTKEKRKS
jgi:hypothetical protein